MSETDEVESSEFGRMVRRRRDGVEPGAVGLPAGGRRRATGLRREEVAHLAGISVDYLTRLEQGRATSPSAQVVEALARALRLPDAERDVLFRLAGHVTPGRGRSPRGSRRACSGSSTGWRTPRSWSMTPRGTW